MKPQEEITKESAWDTLLEMGVSEQALRIVTCINGFTLEVLEEVLYAYAGYTDFCQLED